MYKIQEKCCTKIIPTEINMILKITASATPIINTLPMFSLDICKDEKIITKTNILSIESDISIKYADNQNTLKQLIPRINIDTRRFLILLPDLFY